MNTPPPRGLGPGYLPVVDLATRVLHGFELTVNGPIERGLEIGVRAAASWSQAIGGPVVVVDLALTDVRDETAALIGALLDAHPMRADALIVRVPTFALAAPSPILDRLVERGIGVAVREIDLRGAEPWRLAGAPIDLIELPPPLVESVDQASAALAGVTRLIQLAHGHDWLTMARGVARAGQLDVLGSLGCDLASGPAIGVSLPRADADRVVARYFPGAPGLESRTRSRDSAKV